MLRSSWDGVYEQADYIPVPVRVCANPHNTLAIDPWLNERKEDAQGKKGINSKREIDQAILERTPAQQNGVQKITWSPVRKRPTGQRSLGMC